MNDMAMIGTGIGTGIGKPLSELFSHALALVLSARRPDWSLSPSVYGKVILCSLMVLAQGCTRAGAVWIVSGSTAQHLVFGLGRWRDDYKPIGVRDIEVVQRTDSFPQYRWKVRWRLLLADPLRLKEIRLTQIPYGTTTFASVPPSQAAQPLVPGDYEVTVSFEEGRSAVAYFVVTANGGIKEREPY